MTRYAIPVLALFVTTSIEAQGHPALPDNLLPVISTPCTDDETKASGICKLYADTDGNGWMVFSQYGHVMFIRYTEPGQPYLTIWSRSH